MKESTGWLNDGDKSLIAMGAAMGAGCRTCAEKLHRIALDQNLSTEEILAAFMAGLEGKAETVQTMKEKVKNLMDLGKTEAEAPKGCDERLASLIRMASLMAANSAPDACREMRKAVAEGMTERELKVCRSIARMVREQAVKFSDQEIGEKWPFEQQEGENPPVNGCCADRAGGCG